MTSEFESSERARGASDEEAPAAGSLPPPARAGARLRLAALLALGLGCLITAWQLRGSAGYALSSGGPRDLGDLTVASLDDVGARGAWVRGLARLEPNAALFERRGEHGSLLLGRVAERRDLWVLLPVPAGTPSYFPPRVLEGRLLARESMSLSLRPILSLMQARGGTEGDHLLVVGSRPSEHRTDLLLLLILTTLGVLATVRFAMLTWPVRGQAARS